MNLMISSVKILVICLTIFFSDLPYGHAFANSCSQVFSDVRLKSAEKNRLKNTLTRVGYNKTISQKIVNTYPRLAIEISEFANLVRNPTEGRNSEYKYQTSLENLAPVSLYRGLLTSRELIDWTHEGQVNKIFMTDDVETAIMYGSTSRNGVVPPPNSKRFIIEFQVPRHIIRSAEKSRGYPFLLHSEYPSVWPFVNRIGIVGSDNKVQWVEDPEDHPTLSN